MRLLHVVGTRPNFVKMAPVIAAARERFGPDANVVVHTGQHYDRAMSDVFFDELGVPEPDHMLGVGSGSHAEQTARVMERLEPVLRARAPRPRARARRRQLDAGGGAVRRAARHPGRARRVRAAQLRPRRCPRRSTGSSTDQLSALLLPPLRRGDREPARRGRPDERMHFVGNTMIDTLVALEDRFRAARRRREARARARLATCSSRCTARRWSTGRCSADAMRSLAAVAARAAGPASRCIRGPASDCSELGWSAEEPVTPRRPGRLPRLPLAGGRRRRRC